MNTKVNEGKLISGREALIAIANGEKVQWRSKDFPNWGDLDTWNANTRNFLDEGCISEGGFDYRLKPRTITINGIEVPAPFEPKEGDIFYILSTSYECGYVEILCYRNDKQGNMLAQFGAWRTEEEIKQVISALRFVLNGGWHEQ